MISLHLLRKGYCRMLLKLLMCIALLNGPLSLLNGHAQGLPLIRNYTAAEYGGHNRNYDIELGEDGTIFVANFEGLLYYDRSQWRILHTPEINRVTVVYRDSKNTVWVGGYNFFARLKTKPNGELYMQPMGKKGFVKGEVMEIFEDEGKVKFIASDNYMYEVGTTLTKKKLTDNKFSQSVESEIISLDDLKNTGKVTILEGITQTEELDGGLKVNVKKNNGLIITDSQGKELYAITEENGLCSNQVAYVVYDGHGLLWGATGHGIFSIELPSVYSYILTKDGLAGEVHAIMTFNNKTYVGTTNGLYVIANRHCKRIDVINNICWKLCHSNNGLLAATSSGIFRIGNDGSVSNMTANATTAMLVDGNKVYAGEADGVYCYEGGQAKKIADLPMVTDITTDSRGRLLIQNVHGEKRRITVASGEPLTADADGNSADYQTPTYDPLANLPSHLLMPFSDLEITAKYRNEGLVWIGGDETLVIIDTEKHRIATLSDSRNVRFTSIVMGNDSVLWGGYGKMPKELQKLGSNERHLHFYYTLDYAGLSGTTLYRYRLNNNRWSAWTEKKDVEFLNLPYGSFTLSVQAKLANGEFSDVASVDFSIAYPLYMRWYMVVLYLIGVGYIVYLLLRYRLKRLEKDKIKLEEIVEERTADLRNAQHELIRQEKMASVGKLTEGLIDRILNPMNYIINFSKMSNDLLKDLKENIDHNKESFDEDDYADTLDLLDMLTENLQNVDQYGQNTTRTLKAMEEMLKDRTGGYVDMDLLPVLQQNEEMLNNYFAKEKEQHHIKTTFTLPSEAMPMNGNPDMLSKTIMSLLGNAIYAVVKKAQKGAYQPAVSLSAAIVDGHYVIKIHDNGIGIEEKILSKVFDPFFTTKTTGEAAGVGLYLSREIIQNHGGDISVKSVKDEFTEFTMTLPRIDNR